MPRTNNNVEAWHKAFEMCCGPKPGVYKLIQNFREKQKLSEIARSDSEVGKFYSKVTDKEIRIYFMCTKFDSNKIDEYLKGRSQNLAEVTIFFGKLKVKNLN